MGAKTLFLSAGHGGADAGNTAAGPVERDELIGIAGGMRRMAALLGYRAGLGGVVFLDDGLDLQGQLAALRGWKPSAADGDLGVDLHLDYHRNRPSGGALVIYDEQERSKRIADVLLQRWCKATGIQSNGIHRSTEFAQRNRGFPDFGFCAPAWPGIIFELGSLNNARDMSVVRDPFCQALALHLIVEAWREI